MPTCVCEYSSNPSVKRQRQVPGRHREKSDLWILGDQMSLSIGTPLMYLHSALNKGQWSRKITSNDRAYSEVAPSAYPSAVFCYLL